MGQVKRVVKCIEMLDDDKFFYCGTTTGDIIAINTQTRLFQVYIYVCSYTRLHVCVLCTYLNRCLECKI